MVTTFKSIKIHLLLDNVVTKTNLLKSSKTSFKIVKLIFK